MLKNALKNTITFFRSSLKLSRYVFSCYICSVKTEEKVVAFTFDDGPSPETTLALCDLFKQYDGKATFFFCGHRVEEFPELVKQVHADGFEVANHSYSHLIFSRNSAAKVLEEIKRTNELVEGITGEVPTLVRPPQFKTRDWHNLHIHFKTGMKIAGKSLGFPDYNHLPAQEEIEHLLSEMAPGAIICLHDYAPETLKALAVVLPELHKQGYQFKTMSQLCSMGAWDCIQRDTKK